MISHSEHFFFEPIDERTAGLADQLLGYYEGNVTHEDVVGRYESRPTDHPVLLTQRFFKEGVGVQAYVLKVLDVDHSPVIEDMTYWAFDHLGKAQTSIGEANSFEARVQEGIVLMRNSGILFNQFYPPLLTEQPQAAEVQA